MNRPCSKVQSIVRLSVLYSFLSIVAVTAAFRPVSFRFGGRQRRFMMNDGPSQGSAVSAPFPSLDGSGDENDNSNDAPSSSLLVSSLYHLGNEPNQVRLVLASASPRRREILDMMGLKGKYTVQPSSLDESALQTELAAAPKQTPFRYTQTLAEAKAKALADAMMQQQQQDDNALGGTLILGSDTIVDLNGTILEKPSDTDDAVRMLKQLSGNWHKVHTGVSVYHVSPQSTSVTRLSSFVDTALVQFASLSPQDIESYVDTGEPMDKAGSYGIQGIGGQLVQGMQGDFFTVMGLPMHKTSKELSLAISKVIKKE